eukprot:g6759.t1
MQPLHANYLGNLGVTQLNLGDLEAAERTLRKALMVFPSPLMLENMALVHRNARHRGVELDESPIPGARFLDEGSRPLAKDFCTNESVRVSFNNAEASSSWGNVEAIARAAEALDVCGFAVVHNALHGALLERIRTAQHRVLTNMLDHARGGNASSTAGGGGGAGVGAEADMAAMHKLGKISSQGRYLAHLPFEPPFDDPGLLDNAAVGPVLDRLLGGGVTGDSVQYSVDVLSSVTSLPRTGAQHWHADAGFLYEKDGRGYFDEEDGSGRTLPAFGAITFWPLVDTPPSRGPAEFLAGSHIACAQEHKESLTHEEVGVDEETGRTTARTGGVDVCPGVVHLLSDAPAGSCVMFDMRTMHRGGANLDPVSRPMLYITFSAPWWTDAVNFHAPQSSRFDSYSAKYRRRVARLDHLRYVAELERLAAANGVDPRALQSAYNYDPLHFKDISPEQAKKEARWSTRALHRARELWASTSAGGGEEGGRLGVEVAVDGGAGGAGEEEEEDEGPVNSWSELRGDDD